MKFKGLHLKEQNLCNLSKLNINKQKYKVILNIKIPKDKLKKLKLMSISKTGI